MRDKLTKSLTVNLDLHTLNNNLLNGIQEAVNVNNEKYPNRNCTLKFKIRDEAMLIELPSKTYKVNPSDDLMADIFNLTHAQPVLA